MQSDSNINTQPIVQDSAAQIYIETPALDQILAGSSNSSDIQIRPGNSFELEIQGQKVLLEVLDSDNNSKENSNPGQILPDTLSRTNCTEIIPNEILPNPEFTSNESVTDSSSGNENSYYGINGLRG